MCLCCSCKPTAKEKAASGIAVLRTQGVNTCAAHFEWCKGHLSQDAARPLSLAFHEAKSTVPRLALPGAEVSAVCMLTLVARWSVFSFGGCSWFSAGKQLKKGRGGQADKCPLTSSCSRWGRDETRPVPAQLSLKNKATK